MFIKQQYKPSSSCRSVYFINHNLWWDGLLPLYLSKKFFDQQARALMEDKQMLKHSFFSKIGAFSIDLNNPRSALQSLRFAIESMNRDRGSLYIYPEGELTPVSDSKPVFKKGLAWLYKNMKPKVDFVPIAFYTQTLRDSKPELYINVGSPLDFDRTLSKEELTTEFEMEIYLLMQETRTVAGFTDKGFVKV